VPQEKCGPDHTASVQSNLCEVWRKNAIQQVIVEVVL
jgi:hypothetical protein